MMLSSMAAALSAAIEGLEEQLAELKKLRAEMIANPKIDGAAGDEAADTITDSMPKDQQ